MPEGILAALVAARAERKAIGYSVHLTDWTRALLPPGAEAACDARLRSDRAGMRTMAALSRRTIRPCG